MDNLMLPVEFMKVGFAISIPLLVIFVLISFVRNQVVKCILCLCKAMAYLGLAFLMWKFYCDKEQVDVVSAFTFIFCCFESVDNIVFILSVPIEYIHKRRDEKLEYELKMMELESEYDKYK